MEGPREPYESVLERTASGKTWIPLCDSFKSPFGTIQCIMLAKEESKQLQRHNPQRQVSPNSISFPSRAVQHFESRNGYCAPPRENSDSIENSPLSIRREPLFACKPVLGLAKYTQ